MIARKSRELRGPPIRDALLHRRLSAGRGAGVRLDDAGGAPGCAPGSVLFGALAIPGLSLCLQILDLFDEVARISQNSVL